MEQDSENVDKYLAEKDKVEREMTELREKLALAEKMRKEECNNKEVEKMDAVEKLRKQMLYQIKKTKANLLALNDEQLAKTTRLTML